MPEEIDGRSDEALVAAFVAGDRRAFDALVTRYERRVYGICLRYFGDATDAEDALQETFLTLLRKADTFRGGAAFSTWLYRVATNACNDLARRRARRPRSDGAGDDALAHLADPSDDVATRDLALDLQRALRTLDDVTRRAVVLHDVVGLPYEDVATRLRLPVGTVKSRIHRGHARLAGVLADLDPRAARPAGEPPAAATPPTPRP